MKLNWTKCQGGVWCKLNFVNLNHEHFNNKRGICIIWHGGTGPKVVYVGQGDIRERLTKHRSNPDIQKYEPLDLYVTWATVPESNLNGVEAYLAKIWAPKVGMSHPIDHPVQVNSPWE